MAAACNGRTCYEQCNKGPAGHQVLTHLSGMPNRRAGSGQALVEELLARGAALHARDEDGWNAFRYACWVGHAGCAVTLLRQGCRAHNVILAPSDGSWKGTWETFLIPKRT